MVFALGTEATAYICRTLLVRKAGRRACLTPQEDADHFPLQKCTHAFVNKVREICVGSCFQWRKG